MTMQTADHSSAILAHWIANFRLKDCKEEDVKQARLRILDLLISAAAGWRCNAAYNGIVKEVFFGLGGTPKSSVLFDTRKTSAATAAYLNATFGHGADLDDGHRIANGHPGVSLIPAVLALAESEERGFEEVCAAVLVGYEVYIRLSRALQPDLMHRGFHGTGVVGAVAASAACAKLLGLDEWQTHNALSFGAIQASGLFEVSESGQASKPINPANACRTGVESALLAREGADAPLAPFEGVKGMFHAFTDHPRPSEITDHLGEQLAIQSCYIKLSPACRHTHPSIDAGITLGKRNLIDPDKIDRIRIYTYPNAVYVTGSIAMPQDAAQAKFSMRYALAMALQHGRYSLKELEEAGREDPKTELLIQKMEIISDPAYEDKDKGIRGGRVELVFTDGRVDSCYVPVPRGELENPLQEGDITAKVDACCEGLLPPEQRAELFHAVMMDPPDLKRAMRLLCVEENGLQ